MTDELTVIIVALLGGEATDQCLDAVRPQTKNVLIVERDGTVVDLMRSVVGQSAVCSIPAKRREAVAAAQTRIVALIEDTVIPDAGWVAAIMWTLASSDVVACGGPVRVSSGLPPATRALALSEYGTFGEDVVAGGAPALPGCNFAFRRDALCQAMDGTHGLVDRDVFRALTERGGKIMWATDMSVIFAHPFPDGARLRTRFDHGRLYASSGAFRLTATRRAVAAAKALLLPLVLTFRSLSASGRAHQRSPTVIGWLLLQNMAWAAGEFAGALVGPPRDGFAKWN